MLSAPRPLRGFTLVELLVTVVILGVVIAPLANGVISFLKHTDATTTRISASRDAQVATAYFSSDVASVGVRNWTEHPFVHVQSVETSVDSASGLHPCGSSGTAALRLAWDDFSTHSVPPSKVVVAYVPVGSELHRLECRAGTLTADTTLVRALVPGSVVASCVPGPCSESSPLPRSVSLAFEVEDTSGGSYPVVLTGSRRQS